MKHSTRRRATVVLASALAGIVPTAAAAAGGPIRPDDRPAHGVGAAALEQSTAVVRPDDRPGLRGPGAVAAAVVPSPIVSSPGFDWADAGIGAFGAVSVVLLLAGGAVLVTGRRPGARVAIR